MLIAAVLGLLAFPVLAGASSRLTATGTRIGDHPAFVRVVVDFNGKVPAREVELESDPPGWMFAVDLHHPGVTTQTVGRTDDGVHVALQPGTQMLHIAMDFAVRRFKYVSYTVVSGTRLAIDLWKSAAPSGPTQTCKGLSLDSWHVKKGVVTASGSEHGIFENQFQVVVRGTHGKVILGQKHVIGSAGSWSTKVSYHSWRGQVGTLEAVAFSQKDGSLECLAQRRVWLRAS